MRALDLLLTALSASLALPFALFAGFWWMLPISVQAEFRLPTNQALPLVFLAMSFAWLFNRWPSNGLAFVRRQRLFGPKLIGLGICSLGYLYGLVV
jgi:hypothetical protein